MKLSAGPTDGERSLGIFGALDYLRYVGVTAITAMGESAMPRLARCYAAGRTSAFVVLLAKLAGLGAAIGAAGVAVALVGGRPILAILYGPAYADHSNILVWTMLAAAIGYVAAIADYGITAARHFRIQIPLSLLTAAVTAVACWWLVPRAGLTGAAVASCLMAATQLGSRGLVIAYAMRAPAGTSPAEKVPQS